jgi:glycosyltransferase involved in cell wall biosynthesis
MVVHSLAREYIRLGHKVRVVGPSGWIKLRKLNFGYPVHRWPTLRGLYEEKVNYAQLRLDVGLWGCDVIHAHNTFPNGYAAAQLTRKCPIPLIITPHGKDIHMIPEIGFGHRLDPVKRQKIEVAIRRADILTSISDSIESSIIDTGCPLEKIRKIPNGIDCERFQRKDLPDIHNWLGLEKDISIILSVGNYHQRKGHEVMMQAMSRIIEKVPHAHLVIVGRGTEQLQSMVDNLGIQDNVHITGSIPFPLASLNSDADGTKWNDDRLAALYSNSDVYVSASISEGAEGLSLALLDAMAARLPVVATRISGNKDIVKDKQSGYLVPPSDPDSLAEAVISILLDSQLKHSMRNEGYKLVQPFHWKEIAKQYISLYYEIIEKFNKRRVQHSHPT